MKNFKWIHGLYLLPALFLIGADQALKLFIREGLPLYTTRPLLPGVVELTYVQNTGAAFSLFSEHTWILALISALASLLLLFLLLWGTFPHPLAMTGLCLILGGAVGNLIDRVALGFVVDMFSLQFVNFAIFNIADIGVCLGGVLLFFFLIFFWGEGERGGKHSASARGGKRAAPEADVQAQIAAAVARAQDPAEEPEFVPDADYDFALDLALDLGPELPLDSAQAGAEQGEEVL